MTFSFLRTLALLLSVTTALTAGAAASQSPPTAAESPRTRPLPLDLAAALQLARRSGPGARVVEARRDAAVGRARESTQYPNPTLEWRRENLGSALDPDIFATAYIPLDLTGRRLALRRAGQAGRTRAGADALAQQRDAELQVARAWLRAALTEGSVQIARQQRDAMQEIARVDAARLQEGVIADAVALRTGLEADRARVVVATAAGEAARARAELARILGVPDDQLPLLAPLAAPALPEGPDSSRVRELVRTTRPELAAREAALEEARAKARAEQRGMLGDVQLQGGSKETGGFLTGQLGVALPFPLFNRNEGARQRSRGELAEALALRDDALLAVRGDVVAAWRAYAEIRRTVTQAGSFSTRGREVATIARVAYGEGQASLVELLDAERAAAESMTMHLRWAAEAWLARLEFERALGARLDADGPLDLPLLASLLTSGS